MKNIQDSVIAFCDFETTGLCHQYDRIVQSAIVVHSFPEGKTIRHLDLLTNPGSIIPSESANIHGIKTEDVADKEMLSKQVGTLFDMFEGVDYVCAYNGIGYDRPIFLYGLEAVGVDLNQAPECITQTPWIDPLMIFRHKDYQELLGDTRLRLVDIAKKFGMGDFKAHNAFEDTVVLANLFVKLIKNDIFPSDIKTLFKLQFGV